MSWIYMNNEPITECQDAWINADVRWNIIWLYRRLIAAFFKEHGHNFGQNCFTHFKDYNASVRLF